MFQLDLNEKSITYILSRTRDIDPINRRAIYAQMFESIESMAALSAEHRLIIAKNGLRDREENVKKSAARLLARWAGATPGGLLEVRIDARTPSFGCTILLTFFLPCSSLVCSTSYMRPRLQRMRLVASLRIDRIWQWPSNSLVSRLSDFLSTITDNF